MSLLDKNQDIQIDLPDDWQVCDTEHESIIRIEPIKPNNYFITIQEWNQSYIVIPYIPSENKDNSIYHEEQQKICSDIDDAIFHTKLLINKWK